MLAMDASVPPDRLPRQHLDDQRAGQLEVEFAGETAAPRYALALVSLLADSIEESHVFASDGRCRDDLDLPELAARLWMNQIVAIRLETIFSGERARIFLSLDRPRRATLHLPIARTRGPMRTVWLQADGDHPGPLPVLAIPTVDGALAEEAAHALVALAARVDRMTRAELTLEGERAPIRRWATFARGPGARPVIGEHGDSCWRLGAEGADDEFAVAWCDSEDSRPDVAHPSSLWWAHMDELTSGFIKLSALEKHLKSAFPSLAPWRLVDIAEVKTKRFMTHPEGEPALVLAPAETSVLIGIDRRLPGGVLRVALFHALGHLAYGHVRPGDRWGHWDTAATIACERSDRVWDQDAGRWVTELAASWTSRSISSLSQCTAGERARLGLWRMLDEMLGEQRPLHSAARRYQPAAYQRHAAQRIVAMLEDYGGAMLCDGVGLGKTYVATTVIAHYANTWRDRWAARPERLVADPFRVTVVAPHAVTGMWRREALPGLAAAGVPLANVRVVSHPQLSRILPASELLEPSREGPSDLEHLLLSDLVIIDEAHNFRSLVARRTRVLRDLLRLQARRDERRRVLLLTATPINNSLEDLRQEASLLFSRPLWLGDAETDDAYRLQATAEVRRRCAAARTSGPRDVAVLIVHGQPDARFADTIEFREDLDLGPGVRRLGDYLKQQDARLKALQERIRLDAQDDQQQAARSATRIAEDLLDRIVVQRSRALCREIERQHAASVELLFRPEAGAPERLSYSDEYDGTGDVLARFLPLFDAQDARAEPTRRPLSLRVYMWSDVRDGRASLADTPGVVGLQRVLCLKRLESSPVAFLITLLRLVVLHAFRLHQLAELCAATRSASRRETLVREIDAVLDASSTERMAELLSLASPEADRAAPEGFVAALSRAHVSDRSAADPDDPPPQLTPVADETGAGNRREELDRLWQLRGAILADFETLLSVTPELADIVLGRSLHDRPRRLLAGGAAVDWPCTPAWGLRLVKDGKLRQLVVRLLAARRSGQKVVVFSQFGDTITYINSVLEATRSFTSDDWQHVLEAGLGPADLAPGELAALCNVTSVLTGDTPYRDDVVNAFAPFYRIGPIRPAPVQMAGPERRRLDELWEASWRRALARPVDVLLTTDVLAEGVNLQDAAILINFDVHWNPVRMIQRAGRIDRRLNPLIEDSREFPDLAALAARLGYPTPRYYWHDHRGEPPITVNMLLPDELEAELLLRERIATKTLAIDVTLGLEQGTGAEADWMASYTFQGICSLNSFQRDRAIERLGGLHGRLARRLTDSGVHLEWAGDVRGWFRSADAPDDTPAVASVTVRDPAGRASSLLLRLDGAGSAGGVAAPIGPHELLAATERLEREVDIIESPESQGRSRARDIAALAVPTGELVDHVVLQLSDAAEESER